MSLSGVVGASAQQLKVSAASNIASIHNITHRMHLLALNALIEAAHAGDKGAGFSVVAQEVKSVAGEIRSLAEALGVELTGRVDSLRVAVDALAAAARSDRLGDLALNAVEIIDRNLYERTCDVRWWATDSAVVDCALSPTPQAQAFASHRLGVILSSYTVYLDLWLCDLKGRVLANGRPDQFNVVGADAHDERWFKLGRELPSGDEFAVADIDRCARLGNAQVATYVASVREGGLVDGRATGVLAIHFDWEPQARAVVKGVRLDPAEAERSRVMLVDAHDRVIAASDGRGILSERFPVDAKGRDSGFYEDAAGRIVAFHRTPGYETYRGLGWRGVIEQIPE
ncbi:methyl-accepting chemotaxis protein [Hansschlegelia zhihuaiae]|nr:methyl-accepting chemotaxis protein [Hansschlegelia zhihuaiae]